MADFDIDPSIVDWKQMVRKLRAFLDSKPDGQAWKDFYDSSAGTTLIELISGYSAFSKRDLIANRRENYLLHAKLISSVIGMASTYGYSSYRGDNSKLRLKVIPTSTRAITKFERIGSVKNIDLVSLDNYSLISGQTTYIDCVVGNVLEKTLTAKDNSLQVFRFIVENVSETFRLLVNNIEVPYSTEVIKLLEDFWVCFSNPFGGIDFYYLNTGNYQYIALTDLVLQYIELFNLSYNFPDDVQFFYGTIEPTVSNPSESDSQILQRYIEPEQIDSIKINAPLRFETQKTLRGRDDFKKILKLLNSDFIDTNGTDISPAYVNLTYLKKDLTFLSQLQKDSLISSLNDYTLYGVLYKDLTDPIKVEYSLKIQLKSHPAVDLSLINSKILEIFAYVHEKSKEPVEDTRLTPREKKFQHELDIDYIEHELNQLPEIKISRIGFWTESYLNNKIYKRGDFVIVSTVPNKIFECVKAGTSSVATQNWSNNINEYILEDIPYWQPSTVYNVDDIVVPSPRNGRAYKCISSGTSNVSQPVWVNEITENNVDGSVTWTCIDIFDIDTVIWKCLDPETRKLPTLWNEYIILNYGVNIIWL